MSPEETGEEPPAKPLVKTLPYTSPLKLFSSLIPNHSHLYLLESVEGPEKLAEYSFIGFAPQRRILIKDGGANIIDTDSMREFHPPSNDPLATVKDHLRPHTPFQRFRFIGGAVGYLSYDAVRYWETLPKKVRNDHSFPDVELNIFMDGVVFDHVDRQTYYYSLLGEDRLKEVKATINRQPTTDPGELSFSKPRSNLRKGEFEEAVRTAGNYIGDGDVFQVVLSKRYTLQFKGCLLDFYTALREINPSPYMYFLKFGERQVVGSSPEMLVRVERGSIETYPIAGTCPRVEDPQENEALAARLLSDPKERAEHVMLVDLARNDLGRVAEYGSVRVPEFMSVHQYSHVQHIVSKVSGKLSRGRDAFDALKSMLPAGTVSGAPKVRAMEIIEELEPDRRGPYAGAVGYFSYNGNSDFAITIRTMISTGEEAQIQVGAGIVADSDPEREWFETERKAKALLTALRHAGKEM